MVKAVYGLKDAPRAWRKKLHLIQEGFGLVSVYADPQLYVKHVKESTGKSTRPAMLLSAHVDDLKGGAKKKDAMALLDHLEKHVGNCTQQWADFTHVGIEHVSRPGQIYTQQEKYVSQLKEIEKTHYQGLGDEAPVSETGQAAFATLLGGVAWLCLTMVPICVYVQALQRHGAQPRAIDLKKLNVLLRWVRRHKVGILYERQEGQLRLVGVSDAAFKAIPEDSSGLALRGCVVVLKGDSATSPAALNGKAMMLEYVCRRQRRVVRSTFSGELNGLIDTIELLLVVQMCLHQIMRGSPPSLTEWAAMLDSGQLEPPADAAVDARSVFDCLAVSDMGELTEGSLKLHVLSARERLEKQILRRLYWSDTRDMLADGLTKGSVPRDQLVAVGNRGEYRTAHPGAVTTCEGGRRSTTGATVVRNQQ